MNLLLDVFQVVFASSWRAGLLILVVVLMQRLLRGRVPEQVLFFAWIVVALRLLLPLGVPTAWSPYNLVRPPLVAAHDHVAPGMLQARPVSSEGMDPSSGAAQTTGFPWTSALAVLWAVGASGLLVARVRASILFRRRLRTAVPVEDTRVLAALHAGGVQVGLGREMRAYTTDAVGAPALHGLRHPRILLPRAFVSGLTDQELQLVIQHELAHWRRRDLFAQSFLQAARIIHWFNPLVWWATHRARADIELACDEFVLRRQSPSNWTAYGCTLLKIASVANSPASRAPVLGILEDRRQIRERIRRIGAYQARPKWRVLMGFALLAGVTITSLTHETWAREAVDSVVAALTKTTPAGWRRLPSGHNAEFEIGVDPAENFRKHAAGYIKSLVANDRVLTGCAQACLADDYRGRRVRFSARVKTKDVRGASGIWMRVDGERRHGLQADAMEERPVTGTSPWTEYAVVLDVPAEAVSLNYGFWITKGTGQAWFCDPRIEVVSADVPCTNTVREPPPVCPKPLCNSSIWRRDLLPRGVTNPEFAPTLAN